MDAKQRRKALNRLRRDARLKLHGAIPWIPLTVFGAIVGAAIGIFIGETFSVLSGNAGVLGFAVGAWVGYRNANKDFATRIYGQLIQYQPLDQADYRDLQRLAAENKLASEDVICFANREMDRIEPHVPGVPDASEIARQLFAAKK